MPGERIADQETDGISRAGKHTAMTEWAELGRADSRMNPTLVTGASSQAITRNGSSHCKMRGKDQCGKRKVMMKRGRDEIGMGVAEERK